MNDFANMSTEGLAQQKDTVGGNFQPLPSGIYTGKVKLAYLGKSQSSQSQSVTFHIEMPDGKEHRETIFITNRDNIHTYVNKTDGKTYPLPGFVTIDDLCLLTTGYPLNKQTIEEKTVPLYDFEARENRNQNVKVITSILGHDITMGLKHVIEWKQKKNPDTNKYEDTADKRESNTVDKFFHTGEGKTTNELRESKPAVFMETWKKAWNEKSDDKTKGKDAPDGARAGRPGAAPGARPAASGGTTSGGAGSLFGNKPAGG